MPCSSSCRTQDHASWGACVRAKNLRTPALDVETREVQGKADKTLDAYAKARKYGIQPKSTRASDVQLAVQVSEKTGKAYQA